ncbi:MAG: zinc ribbon domain-containing protein [Candidatus Hodarchaeota archaeon]
MKKLELKDVIDTTLPENEIFDRIMEFFSQNQIKIKQLNKKSVIGMYGSRLKAHTRGIRADSSILPVKITINLQDKENATELSILMKKGYIGIPPLGLNKKYLIIFARLMNSLKLQFYKQMYLKKEISKCSNCGKDILYENQRFCELCGIDLLET